MKKVQELLQSNMNKMVSNNNKLYRVQIDAEKIWEIYLNKTPKTIFKSKESSSYNCNNCRHFVQRYGGVVAFDSNGKMQTVFDNADVIKSHDLFESFKAVSEYLNTCNVIYPFVEKYSTLNMLPYQKVTSKTTNFLLGLKSNHKIYEKHELEMLGYKNSDIVPGQVYTFNHLTVEVPKRFIDSSLNSLDSINGEFISNSTVFIRLMEEISIDTYELAIELITNNSILDGSQYLDVLKRCISLKTEYDKLSTKNEKIVFSFNLTNFNHKLRNTLLGTLLVDIQKAEDTLEVICKTWNYRVDPVNYMKASAPISKKQIQEAQKFVEENGYVESFNRRPATLDDIKACDIIHMNNSEVKLSIFDNIKSTKVVDKPSKSTKVNIDDFMSNILPGSKSIKVLFENKFRNSLVSMTTPVNPISKPIMKWDNNFSWTYDGNLAGTSRIKDEVKKAGGFVDAYFRYSIMWNENGKDILDFDAICETPMGIIYYGRTKACNGKLDIDMIRPRKVGVENIYWKEKGDVCNGNYTFKLKNYDGGQYEEAKVEIAIGDEVYNYIITDRIEGGQSLNIATVKFSKGVPSITHHIPLAGKQSKTIYGINTQEYHDVSLVCTSPNYWGDNKVGVKHYFFMINKCKPEESFTSFHNENLIKELADHRKVLQVLAQNCKVEPADNQLCGLGFSVGSDKEVEVLVDNRPYTVSF